MPRKRVKKAEQKPKELHLELPSENRDDCHEIHLKSGDEIVNTFYLISADNYSSLYSTKSGRKLRLESIDPSLKTARIVFRGFNKGANRGRISYKIGEKKLSAEK